MDIALVIGDGIVDIVVENGDVRVDRGLRTAATMSAFSDARAAVDEIAVGEDPRGWWAESAGDPHGSKLFLLDRATATSGNVQLAAQYASAAFGWMLREGMAQVVDAKARVDERSRLIIDVVARRGTARRWPQLWSAEVLEVSDVGATLRLLPG